MNRCTRFVLIHVPSFSNYPLAFLVMHLMQLFPPCVISYVILLIGQKPFFSIALF